MDTTNKLAEELRDACMKIRVKASIPLSALIPIMQRAADALEAAQATQAVSEPVAWRSLCDSEWVNIVNAPAVLDAPFAEDAVREAAKLIEAKLRELNGAHPAPASASVAGAGEDAEHDTFNVWFEHYRMQTWLSAGCDKDRGPVPSAAWALGGRSGLLRGWLARAALAARPVADGEASKEWRRLRAAVEAMKVIGTSVDQNEVIELIDKYAALARQAPAPLSQAVPWGYYYEHKTGDCDPQLVFERWDEPGRNRYVETILYEQPQAVTEDARDGERIIRAEPWLKSDEVRDRLERGE